MYPHIVFCYYIRTLGDIPRVFAELVEDGSLADWISEGRITTVQQALDIAIQFTWGLTYAHEQELVHRDVKPAKVQKTADGLYMIGRLTLPFLKKANNEVIRARVENLITQIEAGNK